MPDRKKVIQALEACASSGLFCAGEKCPYNSHALMCKYHLMRDALELLRDTTNPKRGSCSTCIHEYEPGSDYCRVHQRCKVCGVCSGYEYERSEDDG